MGLHVCLCACVCARPAASMGSCLCAALNSRLNCFWLKIYLTLRTTTTTTAKTASTAMSPSVLVARLLLAVAVVPPPPLPLLSCRCKHDTHNCSIISHKVKNCCSILGVIQSSSRPGTTNVIIVSNCPLKFYQHQHTRTHTLSHSFYFY